MPGPPAGTDTVPATSSSSSEPAAIPLLAQPTPTTEAVQPPPPLNSDVIKTQVVAGVAPEPPKATPLKLQGILFNPTRPSAVINGKPLFVGDRIREFKVIAISRDSATLASSGETNVLNLSE
jgi:hypothetical protein